MIEVKNNIPSAGQLKSFQTSAYFHELSAEVHVEVFSHLNIQDVCACIRTRRCFERSGEHFWRWGVHTYFPYSVVECKSELSEKNLFKYLWIMSNNIRHRVCFYNETPLVSQFRVNDVYEFTRFSDALKIQDGMLFHVGFGGEAFFPSFRTTIDKHHYNSRFDLEVPSSSFSIQRSDIFSTCVNGDHFYLGALNGDLLVVDHRNSILIDTIKTGGGFINDICVVRDRICLSDFHNNCLIIFHSMYRKRVPISIKMSSNILSLQSYKGDLYCIIETGDIARIDLEKSIVERVVNIGNEVDGKPLIHDGFLYASFQKKLIVWDVKKETLSYSHQFSALIFGIVVHREYVFVGLEDGSIHAIKRGTGIYISKIYDNPGEELAIGSFCVYNDTLYAYTTMGEILSIDLCLSFSSNLEKKLKEALRAVRQSAARNGLDGRFICSFNGPNRLL